MTLGGQDQIGEEQVRQLALMVGITIEEEELAEVASRS